MVSIRGNVETRLRKAQGEEADGAVLAAAGMIRLGLQEQITEYLSITKFVPPPGQGILAVEARASTAMQVARLALSAQRPRGRKQALQRCSVL